MMKMCMSAVAIAAACAPVYAGGDVLFGVASYGQFSTQSLYRIDPATGAATLVGSTGIRQINGIAYDGSTLWAYTSSADVYRLNLNTGAADLFSSSVAVVPEGDLAFGPGGLWTSDGDVVGLLSVYDASIDQVGLMGSDASDVSGLAFDGSGTLFGYSKNGSLEDTVVSIDPLTGAATTVGGTGLSSSSAVGALAYDGSTGAMLLSDGSALYSVDTSSGAATFIGGHGVGELSGLAFVPSPVSAAALALLGVGGLRRRRA